MAYSQITSAIIEANNDYEVGGVVLGRKMFGGYIITALTFPEKTQEQTINSFLLDGCYHMHKANSLVDEFWLAPEIIGIWHSHICDGPIFSKQDKISNRVFSQIYNGAVSVLVTMREGEVKVVSYYVKPNGTDQLCETIISSKRNYICRLISMRRKKRG